MAIMLSQKDKEMICDWVVASNVAEHPLFPEFLLSVDNKIIGKHAREFRLKYRIQAKEIANKLNIRNTILSMLENGQLNWRQDKLFSYVKVVREINKKTNEDTY